jgi:hypothetical protein
LSAAAAAADAQAELEPGSAAAELKLGSGTTQAFRVPAGSALGMKVAGPATVKLDIRIEGESPVVALPAAVEVDGEIAQRPSVQPADETGAKSNRDRPVTKAVAVEVKVEEGNHTVRLLWPSVAPGDALVSISGVKMVPAGTIKIAALPLPPSQPKKNGKKVAQAAPPPLPMPGLDLPPAEKKTQPPPSLPLPEAKAAPTLPLPEAKKDTPLSLPLPSAEPKKEAPPPAAAQAKPPAPAPAPVTVTQAKPAAPPPTAAPKAAPATAAPPMANVASNLNLRGSPVDQPLWNVRAFVGGERSYESNYTDSASLTRLGAEATRWFAGAFLARFEFDWRNSSQQYVPLHMTGAQRSVTVNENRFDVVANVGYDVGSRMMRNGRFELTPLLGVAWIGIKNDAFPADIIGVNIGGRTRFYLSPAVIPHAQVLYTYNFAAQKVQDQNSALSSPKGDVAIRAGLALPLAGGYALELDYQGDVLSFENTYRVAHGAALGFGSSF